MSTDAAAGSVRFLPETCLAASSVPAGSIAIVLHDLRGGGAERACLRLAGGLAAKGRAVDLVLVQAGGAYQADIPPGVRVTVLGSRRVLHAIPALAAWLRREKPLAVLSALTHMNVATLVAARLSGTGARIAVSERNQISAKAAKAGTSWQRLLYRAVPLVYRMAGHVIAVSGGVARDLAQFGALPPDRVHVIHNPVFSDDLDLMSASPPDHPWFTPDGPPIVLAVGRLHQQKGFEVLIDAFARTRAQIDCRLVIVGEGPDRAALERRAEQLGLRYDIDLPGFCANPFALMARAGAFVLSSRWGGFPNALVEAMACGAPVIATDCPSGPREILEGAAPLVPVDDVDAMAAALSATLRRRPDTAVTRARARAFSVSAAADRYLQLLERA